ncbi:Multifunctional fusion protein [Aphelenchoides fujianensis]|nr:Multifunctional fusion protein [Aphelenchoides fujianensis]
MLVRQPQNLRVFARLGSTYSNLTSEEFMKKPRNEPVLEYKRGSKEREALDKTLKEYENKIVDVPLCIGKERITRHLEQKQVMASGFPSDHRHVVARFTYATDADVRQAIEVGLEARDKWDRVPLKKRADIMLHAADLVGGKYRMELNATTMLGQGKNIVQAEIDAACELADFLRFNSYFALQHANYKPIDTPDAINTLIYRGLQGFVAAIAPFNFTAIGGNLASAPALMGNAVLWKPSDTAVLSNYIIYKILEEAGVPPGIISFLPSDGPVFGDAVTESPHLAAINFTGSVPTFKYLWRRVNDNLERYTTYPRLVGECGGKNFHFVHPSADVHSVVVGTLRAAFEYSGQKCSACSRLFVPESLWDKVRDGLSDLAKQVKVGDVRDGATFMSAVIDLKSFQRNRTYVDLARAGQEGAKIIFGGEYDDSKGFFVQPTLIQVNNLSSRLLREVRDLRPDRDGVRLPGQGGRSLVRQIGDMTPYGLTGAVFSQDTKFLDLAKDVLRDAVGNLYINDKSTGSVVGQQPFGGARASGTNDKAGGPHYVLKWASPQTIKTAKGPLKEWRYPSMD